MRLLLFLFLVISSTMFAQTPTERFTQAYEISRQNLRTDPARAREFGELALEAAREADNDSLRILALTACGNSRTKTDSLGAADYLGRALSLALNYPSRYLRAVAHNNLGIFHKTYDNYPAAATEYHAAIALNEAADRVDLLADNYQNLAAILDLSKQRANALAYLKKALQLDSTRVTDEQRSRIWNSKGIVHCQEGELGRGITALKRALSYLPADARYQRANTLNNIALAHQLREEHIMAVRYNDRATLLANELRDTS
ncbi:MAG: hypothetical protein AAFN92_21720, partial [Bacteroidota bacterium]